MVNSGTIITKALMKTTGGIPRSKFLVWFNETVRDILNQPREWQFLTEPLSLAIVGNQITVPAGVSEVVSIQIGDTFLTQADQLNAKEAAQIDRGEIPAIGYTLDAAGVITIHPGATGTALVTVEQGVVTDYADNADTVFPQSFENLFLSGLLKNAFYLDKDGRFTAESITYQLNMGQMKASDNRKKPRPSFNPHGYSRNGK